MQPICLGGAGSSRSVIGPRPPPLVVAADRAVAGADRAGSRLSKKPPSARAAVRRAPWQCARLRSARPWVGVGDRQARRHGGGLVLQVLGGGELDPALVGDLDLIDGETGVRLPFSASVEALDGYQHRLEEFLAAVAGRARRSGMDHLVVRAEAGAEEVRAATAGRGGGVAVRFLVPAALGVAALAVPLVAPCWEPPSADPRLQRLSLGSKWEIRCRRRSPGAPPPRRCCWLAGALRPVAGVPSSSRRPCSAAHRLRDGHVRARWRWRVGWRSGG